MTDHDPLCPWSGSLSEPDDCRMPSGWRVCDLIARVREDERRTLTGGERHREWWIAFGMGKLRGRADALAEIVGYLRDPHQMPSVEAQAWANGFAEVIETGAYNGAARGGTE